MAASCRCLFIIMIVIASLIASAIVIPQQASAATGTFTVVPGETKYIYFGTAHVGNLLLWNLSISYSGWDLTYWLENPDLAHLSIADVRWGKVVDIDGNWELGFYIPSSSMLSATISYEIYNIFPAIEILSPINNSCTNATSITVSGTADSYADVIMVEVDGVNQGNADISGSSWSLSVSLSEGKHIGISAVAEYLWGSFSTGFSDSIFITDDQTKPVISIDSPENDSYSPVNNKTISWSGSDALSGIAEYQIRLDSGSWISTAKGTSNMLKNLAAGAHNISVMAIDTAGNWNTSTITLTCDYENPAITSTNLLDQAVIRTNYLQLNWQAHDPSTGIDHYEIKIDDGAWVNIGTVESFASNLTDGWHAVSIKAVDKAGNSITEDLNINTTGNIFSIEGPYFGIPLFALIAIAMIVGVLLIKRRRKKRRARRRK